MRGSRDILGGLTRQAVHQIKVQALDSNGPQSIDGPSHLFERLHPIDLRLNLRVESLHAQAHSGHSGAPHCGDKVFREHTGVEFGGDLRACAQAEDAL